MVLNKKTLILFILVIVLMVATTFSLISLFNEASNSTFTPIIVQDNLIKANLDYDVKDKDLKDVSVALKDNMIVYKTNKYQYIDLDFDFYVTKEGIVITNALKQNFYKYNLNVGDVVTKINDVELKDKNYGEIIDLIYTNLELKMEISGSTILYKREDSRVAPIIKKEENTVTFTVYDLDNLTTKTIKNNVLDVDNIVFDLSKCCVNEYDKIGEFISMFKKIILDVGSKKTTYDKLDILTGKNVEIIVDGNQNLGMSFLATKLQEINSLKVTGSFTKTSQYRYREVKMDYSNMLSYYKVIVKQGDQIENNQSQAV